MAADPLFGWDLTFKTVEKDIKRKSDILVAFIHWNLTKRGFRTIGVGDEVGYLKSEEHSIQNKEMFWNLLDQPTMEQVAKKLKLQFLAYQPHKSNYLLCSKSCNAGIFANFQRTLLGDEEKSEILPTGWNDKENYTLRYVLDDKLYILHGLISDGSLIINLMRSEDLAVTNIAVNIDEMVKEMSGSIQKMVPDHKTLMFNIKRDLIDSITDRPTTTAETQTSSTNPDRNWRSPPDDPLRVPPRNPRPESPTRPDLWNLPEANPYNVGRSDLDPFAPGGGGMLFNPFGPRRDPENPGLGIPGGLPRGSIPPGARFDPFGPPGAGPPLPGRRPPPDADHFPPPGNMFM